MDLSSWDWGTVGEMYQTARQLLLLARDGVVRIEATMVLGLSLNVRLVTTTNVRRRWQAMVASSGRPAREACAASRGGSLHY